MLSKSAIKYIRALQQKKNRQNYKNFVVEGEKMANEILSRPNQKIEAIYALPDWIEQNEKLVKPFESILSVISARELKQISSLKTPNQLLLIVKQPEFEIDHALLSRSFCIFLDDIRDPGNMGTILRIADWFGVPYVFCSPTCVEIFNPKVVQASMGALFRVQFFSLSLNEMTAQYPHLNYYAAMLAGENVFEIKVDNGIIIMGNEARGVNKDQLPPETKMITIPKGKADGAESLNAAVATGIIMAALKNG